MPRRLFRVVVAATALLLPVLTDAAQVSAATASGKLSGMLEDGIEVYRGIPYAAPPVGDLRWRPPQPPTSWSGERAAARFGPVCPQIRGKYPEWADRHMDQTGMAEDCLTLNIWTPANRPAQPLPVMVYFHGGNMQFGAASLPVHDGGVLAAEGVVLVNVNYRIGFLGRFAHPALTRLQPDEPLVNYGLMDQIAALAWVQRNIRAFGGDPGNVTIFGHSAGGVSVNYLMTSPPAAGLFHRAIAQGSGVLLDFNRHGFEPGPPGPVHDSQEALGLDLAGHFDIDGTDAEVGAALRALSADDILEYQGKRQISFNPAVDGVIVPDHIARVFERGEQHDVPYLAGANSWEWNQIADVPLIGKWFLAGGLLEGLSSEDLAVFDDQWTRIGVSQRWFAEGLFLTSTRYLAAQMRNVRSPAYLYRVTYVQSNLRGEVPGAAHGVEMPFVFGNVRQRPELNRPAVIDLTEEDFAWGDTVRGYWVAFARTGDPNGGQRPNWPQYDSETDLTMDLGEIIQARAGMGSEALDYLEGRALARRAEFEAGR